MMVFTLASVVLLVMHATSDPCRLQNEMVGHFSNSSWIWLAMRTKWMHHAKIFVWPFYRNSQKLASGQLLFCTLSLCVESVDKETIWFPLLVTKAEVGHNWGWSSSWNEWSKRTFW